MGSLGILWDPLGSLGGPLGFLGGALVPRGYLWESLRVSGSALGLPWRSPGRFLGYLGGALGSMRVPVETPRLA